MLNDKISDNTLFPKNMAVCLRPNCPVYLSTSTRSSRSNAHFALGHMTHTRLPASKSSSWCNAWANWFTVCQHNTHTCTNTH